MQKQAATDGEEANTADTQLAGGLNDLSCDEGYCNTVDMGALHAPRRRPPFPRFLMEMDELDEEYGLGVLLSKEDKTHENLSSCYDLQVDLSLDLARQEAVQWILAVNSYHSFSAFTAVLSVDYLDRFLASLHLSKEMFMKPWMVQLAAIACLSLAAKVAETHVPLLLDLQVDQELNYVFRPKPIQRMELLVLSLLDWKMNPVTPLSFLSFIIKRVPMEDHKHMEFSALFERFALSLLADSRIGQYYRPSVAAAAITLQVMKQMDFIGEDFECCKNEICRVLRFNKEKFEAYDQLIGRMRPV